MQTEHSKSAHDVEHTRFQQPALCDVAKHNYCRAKASRGSTESARFNLACAIVFTKPVVTARGDMQGNLRR
jgi:hypothetical protein